MLEPGTDAPAFTLQNHRDEGVSLADFAGQRVVVYFYPRADTPGCTAEACEFRDAWERFADRDVTVLGVSDDPVGDIADFADTYDLPFHLLSDEDGTVASAYDSYGEKHLFGDVVEGVFRNTYVVGPDGRVEAAFEGVDPEGHADEVLSAVDETAGD
ncbi:MAG: thioredoxin-dependent thiol peroxidase [Halolamina sp.]